MIINRLQRKERKIKKKTSDIQDGIGERVNQIQDDKGQNSIHSKILQILIQATKKAEKKRTQTGHNRAQSDRSFIDNQLITAEREENKKRGHRTFRMPEVKV